MDPAISVGLVALGSALAGAMLPKLLDFILAGFQAERDFKKYRRDKAFQEIDNLKDEIGTLYELATNWRAYEDKQPAYAKMIENDFQLIGKFNKYPQIASAARDAVQWCKIVAVCEMRQEDRLHVIENKKELAVKYCAFVHVCDEYIKNLG